MSSPNLGTAMMIVAKEYGLTSLEVGRALDWARTCKIAAEGRREAQAVAARREAQRRIEQRVATPQIDRQPDIWCAQCDRRVHAAEALSCQSRWCKAKAVA